MNKSFENLEINYSIKDKSFKIQNVKPKINDLRINADIIIRNENKLKFISNDLENISSDKEYTQNIKNQQ